MNITSSFFSNDDNDLDIDDLASDSAPLASTVWLPEALIIDARDYAADHASDLSLLDEPIVESAMSVEDMKLAALLDALD